MSTAEASVAPGIWLRRQRKAAGLTQEDLAERSGVSVRTIADLERGRTRKPYPSSLRALVRALGLPEEAGADLVARYRIGHEEAEEPAGQPPGHPLLNVPRVPAQPSSSADMLGQGEDGIPGAGAPGSSLASGEPVPRQLPTAVAHFAGRARELDELDQQLAELDCGRAGTVVISAIGGTAGVGKTALALHWAHRVALCFPDGQLYANLRGFDTSGKPADPADVLRGFLDALGVHPAQLPADLEGLAALYRGRIADKRLLVVLDNASDVAQVRPLLPASPRCLVLVTSRRELSALAASEGARLVSLDVLTEPEALELLAARLGPDRAARERDAVGDLARLCAGLPLALSVVVARAAAQPRLSLAALSAELAEVAGRLDALDAGDPTVNVRTVLSLSYRHLSEPSALLFRLLGLHPGPDITAPAAASLAGVSLPAARGALRELTRASLSTEHVPGRYAFHDLLRSYAFEQAVGTIPAAERHAALCRALDHYLQSAYSARVLLYPGHDTIRIDPPLPGVRPESFASKRDALAWLDAEYQVFIKGIDGAVRENIDDFAWRFPVVLWTYYYVCGHWHDGVATQRVAVEAARRRGERNGYARAMRGLGSVLAQLGEYAEAFDWLAQAGQIFAELGDQVGLARTDLILSQAFEYQGQYADALRATDSALRIAATAADDPDMQLVRAAALNNSACCRVQLGDLEQAREACLEALALCRSLGYTPGEAGTLDTLGCVYQHQGCYRDAVECFTRALELGSGSGNRLLLANTLGHLAQTHQAAGDVAAARAAWTGALEVYDDLRHRDGEKVRAKIRELDRLSFPGGTHQPPRPPASTGCGP
jgi:transcriptional regulator with XRE-family HTH domain/tetratricopeptide (TPR) repeat protein